jgi:hypothetical protein
LAWKVLRFNDIDIKVLRWRAEKGIGKTKKIELTISVTFFHDIIELWELIHLTTVSFPITTSDSLEKCPL